MAWYAIQTVFRAEDKVKESLEKNYEVYLPLTLVDRRKGVRRKKYQETEPLFYSYLFANLIEGQSDFHKVKITNGVLRIVQFTRVDGFLRPTIVPDDLIEGLKYFENEQGIHEKGQTEFKKGDQVRFRSGVFKDYKAIIDKISCKTYEERAFLLIQTLAGTVRADSSLLDLEPIL